MIDKKWYLNVVLICISLIVKLEIFFICLKMIEILLSAVYVSFVHFSIEFWFLFSWLLSVLLWTCLWYILQILTPSLIVVFWLCLWCLPGEGNGNPLRYSCLENPRDRGAWRATVPSDMSEWLTLHIPSPTHGRLSVPVPVLIAFCKDTSPIAQLPPKDLILPCMRVC